MHPVNPQRAALQLLRDLQWAGLTHLPLPLPQPMSVQETLPPVEVLSTRLEPEVSDSAHTLPESNSIPSQLVGTQEEQLAVIADRVAQCVRCQELATSRTQTVFGTGNPDARVMFIGEAPGADEDQQGIPFVGAAGQLLNKIIEACGWTRDELYICNILRCRPPGNRNPTTDEAKNCREYLDAQIAIVDPDYIVCWGGVAIKNLLGVDHPIGRMRGRFHQHDRAKVLCTYHPSFLLRNPEAKKPVWEDMKFLLHEMRLKPSGA